MYSFEGKFRTTPTVSLGGTRKQNTFDKEKLLMNAQKERRKREDVRQRLRGAQVIQASVRSFLSRQHLKRQLRAEFDSNIAQNAPGEFSVENMKSNLRLLMFFHSPKLDDERLIWFGKKLIKEKTKWISSDDKNLSATLKVLQLSCKSIESAGSESNITIPLRIVETLTDLELLKKAHHYKEDDVRSSVLKMWNDLIDIGYFKGILNLLSTRVPFDLEPQFDHVRAPTPLAETLLSLLVRPITLATNIGGSKVTSTSLMRDSIMKSFVREVVLGHPSTQLYYFVHPALGRMHGLPVELFVKCTREILESCQPGLPAMLGSLSRIVHPRLESASLSGFSEYLRCVRYFVVHLPTPPNSDPDSDDDSDSETEEMEYQLSHSEEGRVSTSELVRDSESVLSSELFVDFVVDRRIYESHTNETLDSICAICDHLITVKKVNVQKNKLLRTLAFSATFLRQLWNSLMTLCTKSGITGKSVPLVQLLIEGRSMNSSETSSVRSKLVVFCALFNLNLLAVPDTDFYSGVASRMTFSLPNLASIAALIRDVCLSVIKTTLPETRSHFGKYDIRSALKALSTGHPVKSDDSSKEELDMRNKFIHLFRTCRRLVKHLHTRDSRRAFIAKGSWLSNSIVIAQSNDLANRWYRRSGNENSVAAHLANSSDEDIVLSVNEARQLAVLINMPFVVPFDARVSIFMTMLQKERSGRESSRQRAIVEAGLASSTMTNEVKVRREFLYEDAFNDLSRENAPNLRKRLRVQFVNAMGLDEVGYGAGVTREFMQQVIKAGFDPTRGIFKSTAQGRLYPNPHAALVMQDADRHFFFLGRMLGKIIDEGMQVELPFASFFLCKILQRKSADVDINHLQSLDPDFYKNLMYLHDYEGDVSDLGLNFTVVDEALGVTRVTELVQNGKNISVTNRNKDM